MKRVSFFLYLLLWVLCGVRVSAQSDVIPIDSVKTFEPNRFGRGWLFYLSPPYGNLGYDLGHDNMIGHLRELNSEIRRSDLGLNRSVNFGIGYHKGPWVVAANLALPIFNLEEAVVENGEERTFIRLSRYVANISVSYAVLRWPNQNLYVRAAAGYSEYGLNIRRTSGESRVDFDNLSSPENIQAWPLFMHRGATADFGLEWIGNPKRPISLVENFRLGYRWGLHSPEWEALGATIVNPIRDRVGLIYFETNFVIGKNQENE